MPLSEVKDTDLAYLAGLIDGEGCIRVNGTAPRLHITNTDKSMVVWLHTTFGGYVWSDKKPTKTSPHIRYVWEISARKLENILLLTISYLRNKRVQAQMVLDYYSEGVDKSRSAVDRRLILKHKLEVSHHAHKEAPQCL